MPKRFQRVYIEISNVCNLQCTFCPEVEREKAFMSADLFQRALKAIAPLAEEVCFHLMGEPLLHPRFSEFVEISQKMGVPINLTTNGLLLDDARAETVLQPAVRQVNFSLQSFESNFPGKDDTAYLDNLFGFTRRALVERPDLYINFRLWNDGAEGAITSNERMRAKIARALEIPTPPTTDVRQRKSVPLKGRAYLHYDSRFQWPNPHHPVRSTVGFCHGLSSHIGILADGTVVPCCLDKEGVLSLGNCASQSIDDILSGSRARAIHDGFQKGLLVEDLCRKCTFVARFDRKQPAVR